MVSRKTGKDEEWRLSKGTHTGSITVFMSLLLMIIASLLFTLLEGSRYMMLGMTAVLNSQSVTESMFAEYQVPAYQNYHLFMMDSGYGGGELMLSKVNARMQELGQENLNPVVRGFGKYSNFLQMNVTDSSVVRYELATDQNAGPLLAQMSQVMKKEAVADLAQQAYQKITGIQQSDSQGKKTDKYLDGALDTIEQAKEAAKESADATGLTGMKAVDIADLAETKAVDIADLAVMKWMDAAGMSGMKEAGRSGKMNGVIENIENKPFTERTQSYAAFTNESSDLPPQEVEHPMEQVKTAKSSPLLAQILSGSGGISAKQISKEDAVERRTLNIGNLESSLSAGILDRALIMQYLKKYTANYQHQVAVPHALAYEQEYLLCGKYSDEENLEKVAARLLLVREGINFAYLMTDSAKKEEAFVMASAIAAAAAIPGAVKAIQMGRLASWAYAESIVELRTLFSGGKIAAIKSAGNWNVSLSQTASVLFQTSVKAREVSNGLEYEDYLLAFLALESLPKIGNRFANLLEKNLRLYAGYDQLKLDCMITAMDAEHAYHARQAFLTFVTVGQVSKNGYEFKERYNFSYTDTNKSKSED